MPQQLRHSLEREAKINGRSLNSEIVERLKRSVARMGAPPGVAESRGLGYSSDNELTDPERQLLTVFRSMPPTKQLALISLFK